MQDPLLVWDPSYEIDLGPHVFVTAKYRLTRERLLENAVVQEEHFTPPTPATYDDLRRVHTDDYVQKVEDGSFSVWERMQLEIPFSMEGRDTMMLCAGGTVLTCRLALERGLAGHLGGGFHHAYADHGEGFCLLNDVAIATSMLIADGTIQRPAIVDLDVHHGNGTAAIFAEDEEVFTFSMHQENNYPSPKPPSDLDIGLDDGCGDEEYLDRLGEALSQVLDGHEPDLVLYLAGADPFEHDQLGGLKLTFEGLRKRDRMVFESARARDIPVAVTLAGGYAYQLEDTVSIHTATIEEMVGAD